MKDKRQCNPPALKQRSWKQENILHAWGKRWKSACSPTFFQKESSTHLHFQTTLFWNKNPISTVPAALSLSERCLRWRWCSLFEVLTKFTNLLDVVWWHQKELCNGCDHVFVAEFCTLFCVDLMGQIQQACLTLKVQQFGIYFLLLRPVFSKGDSHRHQRHRATQVSNQQEGRQQVFTVLLSARKREQTESFSTQEHFFSLQSFPG